ncbi:hypothetical protein [Paenarthrobacter nitroguajacolicus]|uniref:hypothetical protein n=1 Tax=Paenarthrobacter nitroguajacolicus TaxID=211146 RepID=UPI004054607B
MPKENKYPWWVFNTFLLSTVVLLATLSAIVGGPINALRHADDDGRGAAVSDLITAASWGAAVAAASVAVAAILGLWEGRTGAFGKGLNIGASMAVFVAAVYIALTAQVS